MPTQDELLTELVREEERGRITEAVPLTASYLKSLSSSLLNVLCNQQDADTPVLRSHLTAPLRDRFKSDDTLAAMSRLNLEMIDIQPDVDKSGQNARTWCLNRRGYQDSLSRESVAVLYWELRDHMVWVCVDIKIVSGGVGF